LNKDRGEKRFEESRGLLHERAIDQFAVTSRRRQERFFIGSSNGRNDSDSRRTDAPEIIE